MGHYESSQDCIVIRKVVGHKNGRCDTDHVHDACVKGNARARLSRLTGSIEQL
jgi:hypothetical protein